MNTHVRKILTIAILITTEQLFGANFTNIETLKPTFKIDLSSSVTSSYNIHAAPKPHHCKYIPKDIKNTRWNAENVKECSFSKLYIDSASDGSSPTTSLIINIYGTKDYFSVRIPNEISSPSDNSSYNNTTSYKQFNSSIDYIPLSQAVNIFEKLHVWHKKLINESDKISRTLGKTFTWSNAHTSSYNCYLDCQVQYIHIGNKNGHIEHFQDGEIIELGDRFQINAEGGAIIFNPENNDINIEMAEFLMDIKPLVKKHVEETIKQKKTKDAATKSKQQRIDDIFK